MKDHIETLLDIALELYNTKIPVNKDIAHRLYDTIFKLTKQEVVNTKVPDYLVP